MTQENSDTFVYNGDNQLIRHVISGGATITYTYDGKGTLVKKASSDGTWTIYIGGVYEKHQDESYTTYYNAFGRRVAMRTHTGPSDQGTKHFFLSDQLGSTSTVLSATGAVEQSEKYYLTCARNLKSSESVPHPSGAGLRTRLGVLFIWLLEP